MNTSTFDFESFTKQAAERLKAGDSFFGRDGVLTPLRKEFVEEALDGNPVPIENRKATSLHSQTGAMDAKPRA